MDVLGGAVVVEADSRSAGVSGPATGRGRVPESDPVLNGSSRALFLVSAHLGGPNAVDSTQRILDEILPADPSSVETQTENPTAQSSTESRTSSTFQAIVAV